MSRTVSMQVKTNQDAKKEWILNAKSETASAEHLFYVFVNEHL